MSSNDKPLVSVVMPVYNGERFLAIAIESILAQTFTDFELIIVDDGSQDCSADIVRRFADRDDRIRFFQQARNTGDGGARNLGIAEARGEFIAGMDGDDISLPERLQMQVDFLQSHPNIGAVGVGVAIVNDAMKPLTGWILDERHAVIVFDMLVGDPGIVRGAIMARRDIIASANGYITELGSSADFEFFLRLVWEKDIRYANLPALLYVYRRSDASIARQSRTHPRPGSEKARREAFEKLWGEAPPETLDRFDDVQPRTKLSIRQRRIIHRDYMRLIDSMIERGWVDQADRPLLIEEANRRLEGTTPRLWQMLLHWKRRHFGNE